jgi:hypothetical protein
LNERPSVNWKNDMQGFGSESGFNHISGSISGSGSRRAKMTTKVEKIMKFHVLKCWMFSVEC